MDAQSARARRTELKAVLDETTLADLSARVVEAAKTSRSRLIAAESCTAGALATLLADTPGAGDVLLGGFVTYAKACKRDVLWVPDNLLAERSAVSAPVVRRMTQGALKQCPSADTAIAITCVGGPEPDEDGNPVGLAYIGVEVRGKELHVSRLRIGEASPRRIREHVLAQALTLILDVIAEKQAIAEKRGRDGA